jgi:uncharacterized membrane protein
MGSSTQQVTVSGAKARFPRLDFIDFTRGVVMAIMAWDHVSGFWNRYHHGSEGVMGSSQPFLNTAWFLARFVSHYCAPTFIFLADFFFILFGLPAMKWQQLLPLAFLALTLTLFPNGVFGDEGLRPSETV